MRPEFNSRRLFGITRSKGKMYELGLPENSHIEIPENSEPQELFLLTVGTLGDVAVMLCNAENIDISLAQSTLDELAFSASFFDAFLESRFDQSITLDTTLLAASAYYIARRPGSSLVLSRRIETIPQETFVDNLLHWVLAARWETYPSYNSHKFYGELLSDVTRLLAYHFYDGSNLIELTAVLNSLRKKAYEDGSPRELLFIDIISAIVRMRLAASAWTTLPNFSGVAVNQWVSAIRRPDFPKELWPSQIRIGEAGLFSGESGIIQMPTSAGKTRSVEIILRSGFLSGRTKLAVVVAPFRALCHEIATSLRHAFKEDDVRVNELSDALQLDFMLEIAEFLGNEAPITKFILVLTPEKFLYVLRQTPNLIANIGIVVYDEGHQFDSGSRGITYELLLTQIKALLPTKAQTILVSAVIQNAQQIADWLIGSNARVVNGSQLLTTARAVAFASWMEHLGQLMFYESNNYDKSDYFVPRVIEQQQLNNKPNETKIRIFPEKTESNDISLYLGIRLAPEGAVAIFCGRKDTAYNMASRAVEIYNRGFSLAAPSLSANIDELRRLKNLIQSHFGADSVLCRAASLGIFVHHGTTPQGLRLSIEYAMQKGLIKFVSCTSTLAQGVNLPIRYLIVSGIHQAGIKLKVRDFQNLIGRAGRSGMHTEGLIIFPDPNVYDKRRQSKESWKFKSATELLTPDLSENTTSSLLGLLEPIYGSNTNTRTPSRLVITHDILLSDESIWATWANEAVKINPKQFDAKALIRELRYRRRLVFTIESYLMANRGSRTIDEFMASVEALATSTLAYNLASDEQKSALQLLFTSIAKYICQQEPTSEKQAIYAKTLLGVQTAKTVEYWVNTNRDLLITLSSNEDWLSKVWELFETLLSEKFFHSVEPKSLPILLASEWIKGSPYAVLLNITKSQNGSKPWGARKRRKLTDDDIFAFCEHMLGFECSLILATIAQFLFGEESYTNNDSIDLSLFQKSLKYGLPDLLSISCYERGFADRYLAQQLSNTVLGDGFSGESFSKAINIHRRTIKTVLKDYPSYFESVLEAWR